MLSFTFNNRVKMETEVRILELQAVAEKFYGVS